MRTDATDADPTPEPTGDSPLSVVAVHRYNTVRPNPVSVEPLRWRSSGFTDGGPLCVLVTQVHSGPARGGFLVRDTRTDGGPVLKFSEAEWIAFIEDIESFRGEYI